MKVSYGRHTYGKIHVIGKGTSHKVTVGNFTSIASGVTALMVGHDYKRVSNFPFDSHEFGEKWNMKPAPPKVYGDIKIGSDVWIGKDAVIRGGITIGHGAVIGANCFVCKNVPPYHIVGGNPSFTKDTRFNNEIVTRLLRIKWWDWEDEKIEKYTHLLTDENICAFLGAATNEKI